MGNPLNVQTLHPYQESSAILNNLHPSSFLSTFPIINRFFFTSFTQILVHHSIPQLNLISLQVLISSYKHSNHQNLWLDIYCNQCLGNCAHSVPQTSSYGTKLDIIFGICRKVLKARVRFLAWNMALSEHTL